MTVKIIRKEQLDIQCHSVKVTLEDTYSYMSNLYWYKKDEIVSIEKRDELKILHYKEEERHIYL